MKPKSVIALLLSMLFILAACSNAADTGSSGAQSPADDSGSGAATADQPADTPADAGDLEPIEFTIFHPDYNRRIPPDDAPIVQQVFDATGVMFRWIVPPAEPMERLNVMLATDDLPDLIFFNDASVMKQFINAGKLLDLEDLMKQFAPQAYEINYANFRDKIRDDDGKMYFLPDWYDFGDATASFVTLPETDTTFVMRTGLLEELDWYNPADFDAVFNLLEIAKERYPEMSPAAIALGPLGHLATLNGIGAGAYGLMSDWAELTNIVYYNDEIVFFSDVPEMKDFYAFLNKIHRAGLLDVESPIMSQDMLKEKVVGGRVYSWFGPGWEIGSEFIGYMQSIGSDEQCLWYLFPKADSSVEKTTYARYTSGLHTTGLTVTTKNKDPERFFKFYEYVNTEEGWYDCLGIVNWDFTGENTYENTEGYDFIVLNDQPEFRPGLKRVVATEWMGNSWNDDENFWWNRGLSNFWNFTYGEANHPLGKYDYVGDMDVGMWWDENTHRIYNAYGITGLNYFDKMKETGLDITIISSLNLDPESEEFVIQLDMQEYLKTQLPRVIVADTEEQFNSLWDEMNERLNSDGKDKFVQAKTALFDDRMEDWGLR